MKQALPLHIKVIHDAYGQGVDVPELLSQCLRQIEQVCDEGIFITQATPEQIEQQIQGLGSFDREKRPLWGIPYVVKDNIDVAGFPTTAACPEFSYMSEEDAEAVSILREAGAICLGKTNLDQFATGLVGIRTPFPIPVNSLNEELVPGGSSSGSAIAVAQGIACFALGTDTAGSGRVPAALNSIVGVKPSVGSISSRGVVPACRSLDTVSVFATSVLDASFVSDLICKYDDEDPFSRQLQNQKGSITMIGIPSRESIRFFGDELQQKSFENSVDTLISLGFGIVEVNFSAFFETADLLYEGSWVAERYAAVGAFIEENSKAVLGTTTKIISNGLKHTAVNAFSDLYRLRELTRKCETLMQDTDALCVPSIPCFFTLKDLENDPVTPNTILGTYTNFVNLLDLCGLTIPTGMRDDGLPGSVTLLSNAGRDKAIASLGWQLQLQFNAQLGNTGWTLDAINKQTIESVSDDDIELALVGAHMEGLPLNGEVIRLGGKFAYSARTAPFYRFYKLAGGPPFRPGLIFTPDAGESIALEVWRIPSVNFGEFIKNIPQPLGIGTVTLENGKNIKGFICEGYATHNAEDITSFGGWRSFLNDGNHSSQS